VAKSPVVGGAVGSGAAALALRPWLGGSAQRRDTLHGYLFLAPFLFFYIVFLIGPIFAGFWISLHHWELVGTGIQWVGLQNYVRLLADTTFFSSLTHTVYFVVLTGPPLILLALFLALLINNTYRGVGVFRTLIYLPVVFSVGVLTTFWIRVYEPNYGLLASLFTTLGLEPVHWLQDFTFAMPAVTITTIWWSVGVPMVIFLVGLQDISPSLYEAASLDGAGRWAQFRHITLPGLRRSLAFVGIIQVIGLMQVFGQVFLMTRGGPNGTTRTLVMHIYETSFRDFQLGYGSALSFALFAILFVLSLIQLRFLGGSDR
jgi:multiple sugar transport system permease protein